MSDDELILRFYDECTDDDAARVDGHLAACTECRATWQTLVGTLTLVNAAAVPEPDEDFERRMWTRVRQDLPVHQRRRWSARTFALVGSWAAAVALIAGVSFVGQRHTPAHVASAPTTIPGATLISTKTSASTTSTRGRERVLLTALVEHFAETEMLLVELMNAPATNGETDDFQFERSMADDLVASGRLYRETARQTGDDDVADALDDLEGVLVEVARSPAMVDTREFDSLRARIGDDGLLFKVRAISSDVRDRQHTLTAESE